MRTAMGTSSCSAGRWRSRGDGEPAAHLPQRGAGARRARAPCAVVQSRASLLRRFRMTIDNVYGRAALLLLLLALLAGCQAEQTGVQVSRDGRERCARARYGRAARSWPGDGATQYLLRGRVQSYGRDAGGRALSRPAGRRRRGVLRGAPAPAAWVGEGLHELQAMDGGCVYLPRGCQGKGSTRDGRP
jgi:hypothetical protein